MAERNAPRPHSKRALWPSRGQASPRQGLPYVILNEVKNLGRSGASARDVLHIEMLHFAPHDRAAVLLRTCFLIRTYGTHGDTDGLPVWPNGTTLCAEPGSLGKAETEHGNARWWRLARLFARD